MNGLWMRIDYEDVGFTTDRDALDTELSTQTDLTQVNDYLAAVSPGDRVTAVRFSSEENQEDKTDLKLFACIDIKTPSGSATSKSPDSLFPYLEEITRIAWGQVSELGLELEGNFECVDQCPEDDDEGEVEESTPLERPAL